MSTCPEADLYSAYVDGEVPSPWKEKLEEHIASCTECKKRTERYLMLQKSLRADIFSVSTIDTESSFSRLCTKRSVHPAFVPFNKNTVTQSWTRLSVRIPVPALAAVLLAAIFLPAYFILKSNTPSAGNINQLVSTNSFEDAMLTKALSSTTFKDDHNFATTVGMSTANNRQIFTMINFARQFATDKNLFSNAEIIIIKLPNMTQFSNTGDQLFSSTDTLQQAASFYR